MFIMMATLEELRQQFKNELENQDELFRLPFSMVCGGQTGSGKTFFIGQLIHDLREAGYQLNVIIFYGTDQKLFDHFHPTEKYQGLDDFPEVVERYKEIDKDNKEKNPKDKVYTILILDDLMQKAADSKDVCDIITQGISHQGMSIVLVYQNLLPQKKNAVTIAQNVKYKVFWYNPQSAGQIKDVVRRMDTGKNTIIKMYQALVYRDPWEPLVIDCVKHRAWYGLQPDFIQSLFLTT